MTVMIEHSDSSRETNRFLNEIRSCKHSASYFVASVEWPTATQRYTIPCASLRAMLFLEIGAQSMTLTEAVKGTTFALARVYRSTRGNDDSLYFFLLALTRGRIYRLLESKTTLCEQFTEACLLILGSVLKELIEMVRKFSRQIIELFMRLEHELSNVTTTDGFEIDFVGQDDDRHLQILATVQFCCTKRHARRCKGEDGREEISAHVQRTNVRDQLRVNTMQALQRMRMVDIEVADGQRRSTVTSHVGHG